MNETKGVVDAHGEVRQPQREWVDDDEIAAAIHRVWALREIPGLYPVPLGHRIFDSLDEDSPEIGQVIRAMYHDRFYGQVTGRDVGQAVSRYRGLMEVLQAIRDIEVLEFSRQCRVRDCACDLLNDAAQEPERYLDVSGADKVTAILFDCDLEIVLSRFPIIMRNRILVGLQQHEDGRTGQDAIALTDAEQAFVEVLEEGVAIGRFLAVLVGRLKRVYATSLNLDEEA